MPKRRRPLLGDLCLCALVASAGAVGMVVAKQYMEDVYFHYGIYFPDWMIPWGLAAGAAAWGLMAGLLVASKRSMPLITLSLTQLSLGLVAGLVAQIAH
jgi:hypothetical protein